MNLPVVLACCAVLAAPAGAFAKFNVSFAVLGYSAKYYPSGQLRQTAAEMSGVVRTSDRRCIDDDRKTLAPLLVYLGNDPYFVDPRYVHIRNDTLWEKIAGVNTELYPGWCVHVHERDYPLASFVHCYLVDNVNPILMTAFSQIRINEDMNTTCGTRLFQDKVVGKYTFEDLPVDFKRDNTFTITKLAGKIIGAIVSLCILICGCACFRRAKTTAASPPTQALPLPPP